MGSLTRIVTIAMFATIAVGPLPYAAGQSGDWEDCQTTRMIMTNGYK